jgi:hypothetical protein
MPEINLNGADPTYDSHWRPRVERSGRSKAFRAHYVDETLFVHGLIAPDHFSHWLYNGMMPLYRFVEASQYDVKRTSFDILS